MTDTIYYFLKVKGEMINVSTNEITKFSDLNKLMKSELNDLNINYNDTLKNQLEEADEIFGNFGASYNGQVSGYAVSDRFAYMRDRYGSYTYESGKVLSGFSHLLQSNYGGANDCTLVAITEIANWYRSNGKSNIPSSTYDIYADVLSNGEAHGYTTTGGTNPTKIDNIVEDSFSDWGYYSNHTVAVYGYKEYSVADFLQVSDYWTTSSRFIHWQQMWNEIGSVTKIN